MASHISKLLASLHNANITYRHVNFDNIVFVAGVWRLTWSPNTAFTGDIAPLPSDSQFCAPEQLQRMAKGKIHERVHSCVDIWALGMVLLELLWFRRAFYALCDRNPDKVLSHIRVESNCLRIEVVLLSDIETISI